MTVLRLMALTIASLIGIGIYLSPNAHWFFYVPIAALVIAGVTGFCPGMILFKSLGFRCNLEK